MKHQKVSITLMIVLSLLLSPYLLETQSKPSVNGTWKMNVEKSKFERGGPKSLSIKFEQQGATLQEWLTVTNDRGEQTLNFTYTLDAKESTQKLEGQDIKTSAKWEGDSLVIEFKNEDGFNFLRKIKVSGDGKTMTVDVKQSSANGSANDTVVLEKQ